MNIPYDQSIPLNIDVQNKIGVSGSLPAAKVWDSNYKAVYHLAQSPDKGAKCIIDSTINSNDGTPTSMLS